MDNSLLRPGSAWDAKGIEEFLTASVIPVRLACVSASGAPLVCSLWFLYADESLWCATQSSAKLVEYFRANSACGFEVAPESTPYRGVRGQGEVALLPDAGPDLLLQLVDRYLGSRDGDFARWLIGRRDTEMAIQIKPTWLTSWDFAARMR